MKKAILIVLLVLVVALNGCVQPPVCSNETCETGETLQNCPQDCQEKPSCGDGVCEISENRDNCPQDCQQPTESHFECSNQQCMQVLGAGTDKCTTDTECITPTHAECQNQQCIRVEGEGIDECTTNQDCQASNRLAIAVVDSSIYSYIKPELDQWKQDLINLEGKQAEIKVFPPNFEIKTETGVDENSGKTASIEYFDIGIAISEEVRKYIASKENVESVIIVGNIFPAPIKMDYFFQPPRIELFDYYFASKDNYQTLVEEPTCMDDKSNHICVLRFFDDEPDFGGYFENPVIVGRITPNSSNDAGEIKAYFNKIHDYRMGKLFFNDEAVLYMPILDDLVNGIPEEKKRIVKDAIKNDFSRAFKSVSWVEDDASFLTDLSSSNKASLFYSGHGLPNFIQKNIYSKDITGNNFLFSWLYSCSTGAFFEKDYIAGRMLFKGSALVSYAPTPTLTGYDWGDACDPKGPNCDFFIQTLLNSGATFSDFFASYKKIYHPEMYVNLFGDITLRTLTNQEAHLEVDRKVLDFGRLTLADYCLKEIPLNLNNVSDKNLYLKIAFTGKTNSMIIPYNTLERDILIGPKDVKEIKVSYENDLAEDINGIMTITYNGKNPEIKIPIIGKCAAE